jgi:hypothetical protein
MGKNFIGPDELKIIAGQINIAADFNLSTLPPINFSEERLKEIAASHILILGVPRNAAGKKLTLNSLRDFFGLDPAIKEPCFYNQDWYLNESFAVDETLKQKWYAIARQVKASSRAKRPDEIAAFLGPGESFPSAILMAYTFFANYFLNGKEILWPHDFIWCSDQDKNGDIIYVGRYEDPNCLNKNGFNIHRHLSIRPCYGAALQMENI